MQAPIQIGTEKPAKTANLFEEIRQQYENLGVLNSIVSRENAIRNAVKRWSGPNLTIDPKARVAEHARQESLLQALLRLHRVSCNLVPEHLRIAIQEQDVFSAIIVLNRIATTLASPLTAIISDCEARSIREENPRANQLDPLQLRHLLSFHQNIPHEELNSLDIQSLRTACENTDTTAIQTWFGTITRRKNSLPKDAPQFLRQLAMELWTAGHQNFMETYATELAVFDSAMFDVLGWENSRLFLALFKRIHGTACTPASAFLDEDDLAIASELYKQLGDTDQAMHFGTLSAAFDPQKLRLLAITILDASKENGWRVRSTATRYLLSKKKSIQPPPYYASPEYYAQKSFRPISS